MSELKQAVGGRCRTRKRRILLGQHGQLNLAGHLEIVLHLQISGAQLLPALCQQSVHAPNLFVRKPLLSNIPENSLQPDNVARGVISRGLDYLHVKFLSAARRLIDFHRFISFARINDQFVVVLVLCGKFLGEKVEIGFTDNFLASPAQHLAKLGIGEGKAALQILAKNILRQGLDQGMIKCFRIAHVLFGLATLGDVLNRAFIVKQPPLDVAHGPAVLRNPDDGPVFAKHLRFESADCIVLLHQPHKLIAPVFLHVKSLANIQQSLL